MKTKTVSTDMVKGEYFWSGNSLMANHGEFASTHILTTDKFGCEESERELIVTAVNSCKAINPGNPLAAAKSLNGLINIYMQLQKKLEVLINATPTGLVREDLTTLNIMALYQLKQATETKDIDLEVKV